MVVSKFEEEEEEDDDDDDENAIAMDWITFTSYVACA